MALTAFDDQMSYACPSCVVDRVESAIGTGNIAPIPHHINLRRCDHNPYRDGDDVACWPCLEALKSELKMRWARAFITGERHRANKLRQVANDLALLNDRKANLLPDLTTQDVYKRQDNEEVVIRARARGPCDDPAPTRWRRFRNTV